MHDPSSPTSYRVFARKYRPQTFTDLLGQDVLVRTLAGAFSRGKVAQAYMLTGVRGVGKTTTARLLARAFNYVVDGVHHPGLEMERFGEHCDAILKSTHPDVLEMDAASRTSVDDVREIIDQVRYKPISAPYKVYIIDEVHMLSRQAFNALLKTLEEPPDHAKFIFATTELKKVPVTVLSRCQRFDLKRLPAGVLIDHLEKICTTEGISTERDGLRLLVRAAEGSARDALSLLERAVAHGGTEVTIQGVTEILGLADRETVWDLLETLFNGDIPKALTLFQTSLDHGADPLTSLEDLARLVHLITRFKVLPTLPFDDRLTPAEEKRGRALSQTLSMAALTRAWQMLLKGIGEVSGANDPEGAAEMFLVRLGYAAQLPTPLEIVRSGVLKESPSLEPSPHSPALAPSTPVSSPAPPLPDAPALTTFEDLFQYIEANKDFSLQLLLEEHMRPIRIKGETVEISLTPGAPNDLGIQLSRKLRSWSSRPWTVLVLPEGGGETFAEARRAREQTRRTHVEEDNLVQGVLNHFPGSEIIDILDPSKEDTVTDLDESFEHDTGEHDD